MIRFAEKEDFETVYELMGQGSTNELSKEQFEEFYRRNSENSCVLVFERDDAVLGYGVLSIRYPLHFSGKAGGTVNLIVDIDARSKGIGNKLLDSLEKIASAKGRARIEENSGRKRGDSHRFYYREGYDDNHYKLTKTLALEVDNTADFLRFFGV